MYPPGVSKSRGYRMELSGIVYVHKMLSSVTARSSAHSTQDTLSLKKDSARGEMRATLGKKHQLYLPSNTVPYTGMKSKQGFFGIFMLLSNPSCSCYSGSRTRRSPYLNHAEGKKKHGSMEGRVHSQWSLGCFVYFRRFKPSLALPNGRQNCRS